MTRHSSPCWARPSEALVAARRTLACLAAMSLGTTLVPAAAAAAPASGSVSVTVRAERASPRRDGPKHDLDVVLWLQPAGGPAPPPGRGKAEMDQRGLVFVPHVLAVQKGTTVTFLNNDNDQHNVYFLDDRTGKTLDIGTWGPGISVDHTFTTAGTVITLCKLHLEMAAYVVVVDSPWLGTAVLDPASLAATLRLDGVPPGDYTLHAWHKKLRQKGGPVPVRVAAGQAREVAVVVTPAQYAKQ